MLTAPIGATQSGGSHHLVQQYPTSCLQYTTHLPGGSQPHPLQWWWFVTLLLPLLAATLLLADPWVHSGVITAQKAHGHFRKPLLLDLIWVHDTLALVLHTSRIARFSPRATTTAFICHPTTQLPSLTSPTTTPHVSHIVHVPSSCHPFTSSRIALPLEWRETGKCFCPAI